jgi:hypothetical protein
MPGKKSIFFFSFSIKTADAASIPLRRPPAERRGTEGGPD